MTPIDLRMRQWQLEVRPRFTRHDAALLIAGAYSAVLFGLVIAWVQS